MGKDLHPSFFILQSRKYRQRWFLTHFFCTMSGHEFVCDACGLAFAGSTFLLRHKSVRCQREDQTNTSQDCGVQADSPAESLATEKANEEEATVPLCDAEESSTVADIGTATNEECGVVGDSVQAIPSQDHEIQADEQSESAEGTKSNEEDAATLPSDAESSMVVVDIGATSSENSRTIVEENSSYRVVLVEPAVSKTGRLSKGKQNTTPLVNGETPKEANTHKRSAVSAGKAKQIASKPTSSKARKTSSLNGTKARSTAAKKAMSTKETPAGKKRKGASTADSSELQTKKTKVTKPRESQGQKKAKKSAAAVDGSMEAAAAGKALRKTRKPSKSRDPKKKSSNLKQSLPGEEEGIEPAAEDGRAEKRPRKKAPRKARKERDPSERPSPTKRKNIAPEDKPVFTCERCLRTFKWKSQLDYHMRSHATEKEFKCTFCDKGLSQLSSLKRHLRVHSGEKPYKCEECGKRFVEKGKLKLHQRKHTGEQAEKKYTCSVCDRGFTLSANLTTHMRTHTGEKPYPCPQCGKGFKRSSDVISHLRSHTGERPYKCSHCEKSFTMISHRNRHEVIHTGLKPFKCDLCGKGFTQPNSVKAHLKVHAKKQARLEGRAPRHEQQDRTHRDEGMQTSGGQQGVDELRQQSRVPQNSVSEHGAERKGCKEEFQGVITELMETGHLQIDNVQDDSSHTQNHQENGAELLHLDSTQGLQADHLQLDSAGVDDMEEQEISSRVGTELTTIATEQLQLSCTATDMVSEQLNTVNTVISEKELLQLVSTTQSDGAAEHVELELTPSNAQDKVQLDEGDDTTLLTM